MNNNQKWACVYIAIGLVTSILTVLNKLAFNWALQIRMSPMGTIYTLVLVVLMFAMCYIADVKKEGELDGNGEKGKHEREAADGDKSDSD